MIMQVFWLSEKRLICEIGYIRILGLSEIFQELMIGFLIEFSGLIGEVTDVGSKS